MPMISCPECNSPVSDAAPQCPSCGVAVAIPKRGFFGKLIKWTFIAFNILMLIWMIGGVGAASKVASSAASEAERAGAALGTGIGAMMVMSLWFFGDVILGIFLLLTRPKVPPPRRKR
ncbi:MAG: zinc ribbon domain-containing protein [Myxococcales bacterium]|nr:zinc ribbon domain-containing protein [Myxococcales bacterium]